MHLARHRRREVCYPPPLHRPLQEVCHSVRRQELRRPLQPPPPYQPRYLQRHSDRGWRRWVPSPQGWRPGRSSRHVHSGRYRRRSRPCRQPGRCWPPRPPPLPQFGELGVEAGGRGRAGQLPRWSPPPERHRGNCRRQLRQRPREPRRHPLAVQPQLPGESSPVELSPPPHRGNLPPPPRVPSVEEWVEAG